MTREHLNDAYILTGPTGSGKTALALQLAERLGAEIIAMDSMTLYRGMDVGTAKPTTEERRRVPHHLLDVLDPWESASVAWWLDQAERCAHDVRSRGKRVLYVGGTALYLKALLYGLFNGPPADAELRQRLTAEAERDGNLALHTRLAVIDPTAAARLHPNDVRRVVRALEVWELTGRPISSWQTQWARPDGVTGRRGDGVTEDWSLSPRHPVTPSPGHPVTPSPRHPVTPSPGHPVTPSPRHPVTPSPRPPPLWLDLPREVLYARIDARVEGMVAGGLVEEARALRTLPRALSREAAQALGYKEMFDHLDGRVTLAEVVGRIQARTRNFAKRQLTWFRHLPGCLPTTPELTFARWGLRMDG